MSTKYYFPNIFNLFQVAASVAFLIARYCARDRILKLVEGNKKFLAIDKAIGENGFRVVTLLRLSPLLPFSLGNYLYGLTSVKFVPYVFGRSALFNPIIMLMTTTFVLDFGVGGSYSNVIADFLMTEFECHDYGHMNSSMLIYIYICI